MEGTVKYSISELVELAKTVKQTPADREAQRRSFVYGNVAIENQDITREFVDRIADEMTAAAAQRA
jgi:hypothetical protein